MGETVDLGPGMACPVRSRDVRIAQLEAEVARLQHNGDEWRGMSLNNARAADANAKRIAELEAENARFRTVTPAMLAAAWATWKPRHKDRLGPGPAFREAIEAAIAAAGVPVRGGE